jgi:hypothetical protein
LATPTTIKTRRGVRFDSALTRLLHLSAKPIFIRSTHVNLNRNRFQFNLTIDLKQLPSIRRRYFVALASDL